jgi:D-alanyl-D-alanine dipeptidase
MTKSNKRKLIVLVTILLALAIMITTCINPSDEGEIEEPKNVPSTPEAKPTVKPTPQPSPQQYLGELELPVIGATGYTSIALDLKTTANSESETIEKLEAGTAFVIVEEEGNWWLIQNDNFSGWVQHTYCLINLPDVVSSIIYDNTNTYSSKYVSSGKSIPNITGQSLYAGKTFNMRLGKEEFIVPVLYSMSKKIFLAQKYALADGNSLIIYEGYRPYSVQQAIVSALTTLANKDLEVKAGINTPPWSVNWFIATNISNHQMGYAIDVSLAEIHSQKKITIGEYGGIEITGYTEYTMPTEIHELSIASATFTAPVKSTLPTAWKDAVFADSMNEAAINLQTYSTKAGLTPLASEWWHFNDLDALRETMENSSNGSYILDESYSASPSN